MSESSTSPTVWPLPFVADPTAPAAIRVPEPEGQEPEPPAPPAETPPIVNVEIPPEEIPPA